MPLRDVVQDLCGTAVQIQHIRRICATVVDRAHYSAPTRGNMSCIIQIRNSSALKDLNHEQAIDHTWYRSSVRCVHLFMPSTLSIVLGKTLLREVFSMSRRINSLRPRTSQELVSPQGGRISARTHFGFSSHLLSSSFVSSSRPSQQQPLCSTHDSNTFAVGCPWRKSCVKRMHGRTPPR